MKKGARFSECGKYRYLLWRLWDEKKPYILFVMLNPSTADENTDDPTIRKCITLARLWGYGGIYIGNLFAYRSTDPSILKKVSDPIGPENDEVLAPYLSAIPKTVFAWGVNGGLFNRQLALLESCKEAYCIGKTKNGYPKHPLYLPNKSQLIKY